MTTTRHVGQITTLVKGSNSDHRAMCAMEAVAWLAGEPWSDRPRCASAVVGDFVMRWNDDLPDADRARLLLPLIPHIVGTRTTDEDDQTRKAMVLDWMVRISVPAWCDLLPALAQHATALRALQPLSGDTVSGALQEIKAARAAARAAAWDVAWDAARAAARDVAWAAARDVAWDAARAAARDVARAAARDAAWDAARAAAWDAARDAAWDVAWDVARDAARDATWAAAWAGVDLAPTVATLQASAQDLVLRMCAVGRAEVSA